MTDGLNVLNVLDSRAAIVTEVEQALATQTVWERFLELRMGAGPTVRIAEMSGGRVQVAVRWGSDEARATVADATSAVEAADRLALVLYEIRRDLKVVKKF